MEVELPAPRAFDWSAMAWAPPEKAPVTEHGAPAAPPEAPALEPTLLNAFLPASATESRFYDPDSARNTFQRFANANKTRWPYVEAALDLSRVKIYELSAPYMGRLYEQWKRSPTGGMNRGRWREIFLYAGDHHHATRFTVGLDAGAANPDEADVATRLAWPTAWRREILHWSRAYDLDPYLVLGLIRNESLYRTWALSHAGAIGLMQIIPITGAKVAAHLEEPDYSPLVLENPLISARYGTWYLSRLMERFEGVWPLAVGAYNTGPTNMSSFYQGWQGDIGVDDFVEQIPYRETRLYVKLVTGSYARYLALYGPEGAYVHVPPTPAGDHREVVDF